jgi:hypothetical protein
MISFPLLPPNFGPVQFFLGCLILVVLVFIFVLKSMLDSGLKLIAEYYAKEFIKKRLKAK